MSQRAGDLRANKVYQLQNRKGCKADPPPEVTGDGKFDFSKKMVHYTFQKILSRFDFFDEILDFGSIWRPHRMFNQYILLVVLSLPIDEQLRQRILSLHYWFGCSDSPKLPISCKNAIFTICGHFWAWPLWATF